MNNSTNVHKLLGWVSLLTLFLLLTGIQSSVSGLAKILQGTQHLTMLELSELNSVFYISWLLGSVFIGLCVDKYGIRSMAIIANIICIITLTLLSINDNDTILFITRTAQGFAMSIAIIIVMTYIRLQFHATTFAVLVGLTSCISIMFAAFAAGPLEAIAAKYGLAVIFRFMLAVNICGFILCLRFVDSPKATNKKISIHDLLGNYLLLLKNIKFITFLCALGTAGLIRGTIGSMYEMQWLLLQHPNQILLDSAIVFSLLVGNAGGQIALPLLSNYFQRIKPLASFILAGLPMCVLLLAFTETTFVLWAIIILLGFLSGAGGLAGIYIKYNIPEAYTGSAFSVFSVIGGLCIIITLNLGGYITSLFPDSSEIPYVINYILIALFQIIALTVYSYYHWPLFKKIKYKAK